MRFPSLVAKHVEIGRCSGFPDCCVAHFVFLWVPHLAISGPPHTTMEGILVGGDTYTRAYVRAKDNVEREMNQDIHYVPCPGCLLRRSFVTVLRCGPTRCDHRSAA